jgi:hypothetical protein
MAGAGSMIELRFLLFFSNSANSEKCADIIPKIYDRIAAWALLMRMGRGGERGEGGLVFCKDLK